MSDTRGTLHRGLSPVTHDAVDRVAARLLADEGASFPETIDLPDLLAALGRVASSRPCDGNDQVNISLVELAALALLWSESNDGLTATLDDLLSDPSDEGQAESA